MANIHRSRKGGFTLRGGVMRRESLWVAIAATQTTVATASTAVLFTGLTATLLGMRPFTIVRNRGLFHIRSDQIAATEDGSASYGLAVVSDQALAIGVTAVPTPETDKDSDLWLLFVTLATSVAANVVSEMGKFVEFDSKAMRKVEEGQDIAGSIETTTVSDGLIVYKTGRMLIKLH